MDSKFQIFVTKSKKYLYMYIFSMLLTLVIAVFVSIPIFMFGISPLYLITTILFVFLFVLSLYWFINYLLTPKTLIEIDEASLKINRKFNKSMMINFNDIDSCEIRAAFLSVFMSSVGNVVVTTKEKKKISVGYVPDFIKICGQINSIKFIKAFGGNIDETIKKS